MPFASLHILVYWLLGLGLLLPKFSFYTLVSTIMCTSHLAFQFFTPYLGYLFVYTEGFSLSFFLSKTQQFLTKRIPQNPKYQHVKTRLDTGK